MFSELASRAFVLTLMVLGTVLLLRWAWSLAQVLLAPAVVLGITMVMLGAWRWWRSRSGW